MMEAMEPDPVTIIGVAVAEALAVLAKMLHHHMLVMVV